MIKMNIDISPKPKLTQMKAPVESYNNPKNQNLKHLIESQKLNKDKEEEDYSSFKKNNKNINLDLRATANFGILEPNKIKQFESENEQKLEASNRFLYMKFILIIFFEMFFLKNSEKVLNIRE